jgi:glycosyltransferase involved in cell wall biosynthesis
LFLSACAEPKFDVFPELDAPMFSSKKTFGIVITAFNRPDYLRRTLESLRKTNLDDAMVVIVDDQSTDQTTIQLIKNLDLGSTPLIKLRHRKNSGVLTGILHGFKLLNKNVDFVINIDADVILNRNWLSKLKETYEAIGDRNIILTGFNTQNHPTKSCSDNWCEKETLGGINFFMSSEFYAEHFLGWFVDRDRLEYAVWKIWDWTVVDRMKTNGFKFYTTRPSILQHIGFDGMNSTPDKGVDVADDFVED